MLLAGPRSSSSRPGPPSRRYPLRLEGRRSRRRGGRPPRGLRGFRQDPQGHGDRRRKALLVRRQGAPRPDRGYHGPGARRPGRSSISCGGWKRRPPGRGGMVHVLLGNHEELNITGIVFDYPDYVTVEQFVSFLPRSFRRDKEREFFKSLHGPFSHGPDDAVDAQTKLKLGEFWRKAHEDRIRAEELTSTASATPTADGFSKRTPSSGSTIPFSSTAASAKNTRP